MEEEYAGSRADVATRASLVFTNGVTATLTHTSALGSGFNVEVAPVGSNRARGGMAC